MCVDHCGIEQVINERFRKGASEVTGIPMEHIMLSATHTHTGPTIDRNSVNELVLEYNEFIAKRIKDVALFAVSDLKEAKMGYGKGVAPNVAFVRRYVMKDGSIKTNSGVNNPDIIRPVGETDDSVSVIRFDREDGDSIVFVNFANHPDVVGGCKISADWPGLLRKTVEKVIVGTKCIFFNGAQGDVNHRIVSIHHMECGNITNRAICYHTNGDREIMTGSLQIKGGKYYAVLRINGKQKWINLNIDDKKGKKRKAEQALNETIMLYLENPSMADKSSFDEYIFDWLKSVRTQVDIVT